MGEHTGEYIYEIVKDADGVYCYIKQGELVRCKDCKWYEWGLTECHNPRYGDGWANYPPPQVYDEFFCKDGERKDEVSP